MTKHFTAVLRRGTTLRDFDVTLASLRGILCCVDGEVDGTTATKGGLSGMVGLSPGNSVLHSNAAASGPKKRTSISQDTQGYNPAASPVINTAYNALNKIGCVQDTFSVRDLHIIWFAVEDDIVVGNVKRLPHIDFVEEDKRVVEEIAEHKISMQIGKLDEHSPVQQRKKRSLPRGKVKEPRRKGTKQDEGQTQKQIMKLKTTMDGSGHKTPNDSEMLV